MKTLIAALLIAGCAFAQKPVGGGSSGGGGSGGGVTGSGTTNTIPKFTGATALGDSHVTDNGTVTTVAGQQAINNIGNNTNPLVISTNGSPGNYTPLNSALFVKDATGGEIFRIWGGDPDCIPDYNSCNLYMGFEAGKNATTNNTDSGFYNSGFGSKVMRNTTTASYNSGFGEEVLDLLTIGTDNSGYGALTLRQLVGGNRNTCYGSAACESLVSGNANTIIGAGAGNGTLGSGNVLVGNNAGANETGSNKLYVDITNTATPLIKGDFTARNLVFDGPVATKAIATSALPTCTATTGTPWRGSVNDATAPALGVVLTGGGAAFANVHCSLTTGTYLVDGI